MVRASCVHGIYMGMVRAWCVHGDGCWGAGAVRARSCRQRQYVSIHAMHSMSQYSIPHGHSFSCIYGCSLAHLRLQPRTLTVTASHTYGCSLAHLRLQARSFGNLRGDATLISPCEIAGESAAYTHLGTFVRGAPAAQRASFWRTVGLTIAQTLATRGGAPTWVRAAPLGPWGRVG